MIKYGLNSNELLTKSKLQNLKGGNANMPEQTPEFVEDLVNGDETDKRPKRPGL